MTRSGSGWWASARFFAFVFYFGWDGGRVGHVLSEALRFFFGAVAYLMPLVLLGAGGRPDPPARRGRGRVTASSASQCSRLR